MHRRPFLALFVTPAILVAAVITFALAAILQDSFRAYQPGSLDVGGFTWENFSELTRPIFLRAYRDTVMICFETALFTLIVGYPVAYALVRTNSVALKSFILVTAVTPLFLGEVVRTYAWTVVLGNTGFLNAALTKSGLIDRPIQFLFTESGVVLALVHVTLPVMVIMLAAALSHIDRDYEKAAESLGAGPVRAFLTVTLPLSMPGVVAGFTTAFAWTFSAFATPQIIGGGKVSVVSTLVYQLGLSSFNFPFAATLSLAGLGLALIVMLGVRRAFRPFEDWAAH
ncbi:ABC transporter permease [uncultured Methylobacterium sp.]|uniref:ABC transporter permease n=1 Tax=uncultured Methylobacterium sp. TaxID=157278 RepID=UPI0035CB4F08